MDSSLKNGNFVIIYLNGNLTKSLINFAASWCRCWTRMTALLKSRWFSEALPWFTNKLTRTTDNSTNARRRKERGIVCHLQHGCFKAPDKITKQLMKSRFWNNQKIKYICLVYLPCSSEHFYNYDIGFTGKKINI